MSVPFAIQHYRHRSLPVSSQRVINWFAEAQPTDATARVVMLPTPGLVEFANVALSGPIRGMCAMADRLYVVADDRVYRVAPTGGSANIGMITPGGPVSMATNGTQVITVVPETGEAWTNTRFGALTPITDGDFLPAISVDVLDGYAVFVKQDSQEFFISALNDATSYDALDFASAEAAPDNLVTVKRVQKYLWLFGEQTTEIWESSGGDLFPFLRSQGMFIQRGCAAAFSVVSAFGRVFWLGDDLVVYMNQDIEPVRISTHPIEQEISGYGGIQNAVAWAYEQEGHQFYVLTFPLDSVTWVFDLRTGVWHERSSFGYDGWRVPLGVEFAGGTFGGDARSGQLWRIDPVARRDGDVEIIRMLTGTSIHSDRKRVRHKSVEMHMETGVGLATGQGSDPLVWLEMSDDSGRTWSNSRYASIGRMGAHQQRARWTRLGAARDRVYRLAVSDPVGTAIIGIEIAAEPLDH